MKNALLILATLIIAASPNIVAPAVAQNVAQNVEDELSTFFVGRLAFGENHGNDCGDVGEDLVQLVARASTIHVREEQHLVLSDDGLFETPFLFMNGHNDFKLSDPELDNLRKYFARGGFVFASGCCTNPEFPEAWRRELSRLFAGEQVRKIPYDHLLYRSFYKIESIHSLDSNREIYLEGLFLDGDLVAVLGEEGLCCAFAMNGRCNLGHGVPPEDAKKIGLNIAVYALTH